GRYEPDDDRDQGEGDDVNRQIAHRDPAAEGGEQDQEQEDRDRYRDAEPEEMGPGRGPHHAAADSSEIKLLLPNQSSGFGKRTLSPVAPDDVGLDRPSEGLPHPAISVHVRMEAVRRAAQSVHGLR